MQPSWTNEKHCCLFIKLVAFSLFISKINGFINGIRQINLPLHAIFPSWRITIFKICHKCIGSGVKRIDNHFSINRTCNLYSSVLQVRRHFSTYPISVSDMNGFRWERWELSCIKAQLCLFSFF